MMQNFRARYIFVVSRQDQLARALFIREPAELIGQVDFGSSSARYWRFRR